MLITNRPPIDFLAFLTHQKEKRYRAFLIHGLPLEGKTSFAQSLAALSEQAVYLDVLQYVATTSELASCVDMLDVSQFRSLILSFAEQKHAQLLLVDEFDFLLPIWGRNLVTFLRMIEKLSCSHTSAIIGFFLQTHPMMEQWVPFNPDYQQRILALRNIQPLPKAF